LEKNGFKPIIPAVCNKSYDGNIILVHLYRFKEAEDQHSDCAFISDLSYIEDDSDEIKTEVECNSTEQPPTPNNTPVSPLQLCSKKYLSIFFTKYTLGFVFRIYPELIYFFNKL